MQVESSSIPLLAENKVCSLPGQVCPFHPLSTVELVEKENGFGYVRCAMEMCCLFALASEWKDDLEWILHHAHSDVKKIICSSVGL